MVVGFIPAVLFTLLCQLWALYVLFRHTWCQYGVNNRMKVSMKSNIHCKSVRSPL